MRPGIAVQRADLQCIARATSCDAVAPCLAISAALKRSDCDATTTTYFTKCLDDSSLLYCYPGGTSYIERCDGAWHRSERMGGKCGIDGHGGFMCRGPDSLPCAPTASCSGGTVLIDCDHDSGVPFLFDCSARGQTCGQSGSSVQCLTDNRFQPCGIGGMEIFDAGNSQELGFVACKGDVLQSCTGTFRSNFDCAATSTECNPLLQACSTPNGTCTPGDARSSGCADGTHFRACVGGADLTYDCAKIGQVCKAGHCERR
jgi:hypothetical protein